MLDAKTTEQSTLRVRAYEPFPKFSRWAECSVSGSDWQSSSAGLDPPSTYGPEVLTTAFRAVRRAAAIDTGAIEKLYAVDRGFTFTVAFERLMWETALQKQEEQTRSLIAAQLSAYELLVDLVTQALPITEAVIRRLHEEVCAAQKTYRVQTPVGPQDHELPRGTYKQDPNNVVAVDGSVFSYCPPETVPAEMGRLCEELRSSAFASAHPVVQAAYSHHAFVLVHPFADGNGRVARLLASLYLCRANSIPLLVLADEREDYLSALRSADAGTYQDLVDFFLSCARTAFDLARDSLEAGRLGSPEDLLLELEAAYRTKGGYSQEKVNGAALALMDIFGNEVSNRLGTLARLPITNRSTSRGQGNVGPVPHGFRQPNFPNVFTFTIHSRAPAGSNVNVSIDVIVPVDASESDKVVLRHAATDTGVVGLLGIPVKDLLPDLRDYVAMRCRIAAERVVAYALKALRAEVAKKLGTPLG